LKNQISQAQARLRSLELQIVDAQGKAQGFREIMISVKFDQEPVEAPKPTEKAPGKKTKTHATKTEAHSEQ
jgi:hypothetical protein